MVIAVINPPAPSWRSRPRRCSEAVKEAVLSKRLGPVTFVRNVPGKAGFDAP